MEEAITFLSLICLDRKNILSLRLGSVFLCFTTLGGPHSKMDSILALHPTAPGSILGAPDIYQALFSQWTVAYERTLLAQSRGPQIQLGRTPS